MSTDRRYWTSISKGWIWLLALFAALCASAIADAATQRSFASPEDAVHALVQSVKANDRTATLAVLGPDASTWISSGDATADRAGSARFLSAYNEKHEVVKEGGKEGNRATLTLGADDFPFAFPIVRKGERWRFDTKAGKEEMLARRVGKNELDAINVLQAIVDAQLEYASADRNGDGVLSYAQKFESSPGKHDGLYWPAKPEEAQSPLGELLAKAAAEGYKKNSKGQTPFHGYYYRMVERQGKNAPSGAIDYVAGGRAIGGFAVIAYPAKYGNSGIMSFMVNQDGKIYQSDLGPNTQTAAAHVESFDPGPNWTPVDAH